MQLYRVVAVLWMVQEAWAFVGLPPTPSRSSSSLLRLAILEAAPPTPANQVKVLADAKAVGDAVRNLVKEAAIEAIAARGHFALAIPGGSILKMLVGDDILKTKDGVDDNDWTTKTTLAYVNHKCVAMDDADLATHAKACKLFLNDWKGVNAIIMDGSDNGDQEAASYQAKMEALSQDILPRDSVTRLPVFDLALIGVGDDGHIGSLYPGREEVLVGVDGPWVLPVAMKSPPSITLSLPVMAAARKVVIAACGVSDKYPQGKSAGMLRAVADPTETIQTFPAVGLRSVATWIMDEAAASKLGDDYTK
jgi:6-phosphogluconolactonase